MGKSGAPPPYENTSAGRINQHDKAVDIPDPVLEDGSCTDPVVPDLAEILKARDEAIQARNEACQARDETLQQLKISQARGKASAALNKTFGKRNDNSLRDRDMTALQFLRRDANIDDTYKTLEQAVWEFKSCLKYSMYLAEYEMSNETRGDFASQDYASGKSSVYARVALAATEQAEDPRSRNGDSRLLAYKIAALMCEWRKDEAGNLCECGKERTSRYQELSGLFFC